MALNKSLDKIEDLLKQLESDEEHFEYKNDLPDFITFYNIEPGTHKVLKNHLFNLYRAWSSDPIERKAFGNELGQIFDSSQSSYYLNRKTKDLTQEMFKLKRELTSKISLHRKRHFDAYLNHYSILKGRTWVEGDILYYLYDKWCYDNKTKNALSYNTFLNFCNLYFRKARKTLNTLGGFYAVSGVEKHVSGEEIEQIRNSKKRKYKEIKPKK